MSSMFICSLLSISLFSESNNVVLESLCHLLQMIGKKSMNEITAMDTSAKEIPPKYVRLMLPFDEPHDLLSQHMLVVKDLSGEIIQEPRRPYQVLCRAFNAFIKEDVFAVFLSTTSALSDYSPDDECFWSLCHGTEKVSLADLQAPYVELPFDTFARVVEGKITLESVASCEQMVKFGRPLYVSFLGPCDYLTK